MACRKHFRTFVGAKNSDARFRFPERAQCCNHLLNQGSTKGVPAALIIESDRPNVVCDISNNVGHRNLQGLRAVPYLRWELVGRLNGLTMCGRARASTRSASVFRALRPRQLPEWQ